MIPHGPCAVACNDLTCLAAAQKALLKPLLFLNFARLDAPLHLRLLAALCADVANGTALRAEFAARIDEVTAMQTQHRQLLIEVRHAFGFLLSGPSLCS